MPCQIYMNSGSFSLNPDLRHLYSDTKIPLKQIMYYPVRLRGFLSFSFMALSFIYADVLYRTLPLHCLKGLSDRFDKTFTI